MEKGVGGMKIKTILMVLAISVVGAILATSLKATKEVMIKNLFGTQTGGAS